MFFSDSVEAFKLAGKTEQRRQSRRSGEKEARHAEKECRRDAGPCRPGLVQDGGHGTPHAQGRDCK